MDSMLLIPSAVSALPNQWTMPGDTMPSLCAIVRTPASIIAQRARPDVAVAIDPDGTLHYGQDNAGGDHIIAVLGEAVSDDYLSELREDGVS
jgi:hypothetical protein